MASILKVLTKAIGIFLILYGTLGAIGFNPGGTHKFSAATFFAIYLVCIGAIYLLPYTKLKNIKNRTTYLLAIASPIIFLIVIGMINRELEMILLGLPVLLIAPASYWANLARPTSEIK